MRCVVFAYHNLGVIGLEALARHGFEIAAVYSHEDNPHEEIWFESVAEWCSSRRVPVSYCKNINRPEEVERLRALAPEIAFSFYYRNLLGREVLSIPPRGCLNLHGSLLPKYRGRVPVNWAIIHGETETGVTLHYMVEKPDAGDIVGQRAVPIDFEDTALSVYEKLEQAARELLDDLLPRLHDGTAPRLPNRLDQGSYFSGRKPEDGRIDWRGDASRIYNLVRAVTHPYPGAFGRLGDGRILVWMALPDEWGDLAPGRIEVSKDGAVRVGCGKGALRLIEIEYGGKVLAGEALAAFAKNHEGENLQ